MGKREWKEKKSKRHVNAFITESRARGGGKAFVVNSRANALSFLNNPSVISRVKEDLWCCECLCPLSLLAN